MGVVTGAVLVAACAQPGAQPPRSSSGTVGSSASASPTAETLIVLADRPQSASAPTVLHLVRLDGTEANRLTVKAGATVTNARGSRIFVMEPGALKALHRDGTVEDLNTLDASVQLGTLVASPDGNTWLWASYDNSGQGTVYVAGKDKAARVVEQSREDARAVRPFSWTQRGPVIEHGAVGIGGYIIYYTATGPVDLVEPVSGKFTPLNVPANCSFSDLSTNGTIACFPANTTGHSLTLIADNGKVTSVALPAGRFAREGAAYFSPNNDQLTVGGATGAGPGQEQYAADLVKTGDGSVKPVSVDGVRPGDGTWTWLSDGSLIVYRPQFASTAPGVWLVRPDGSTSKLASSGEPIGVLTS